MAGEAVSPIPNTSVLNNPQNIQQWLQILEQLFPSATNISGSSSSTTSNSSAADGPLQAMIAQLMGSLQGNGFQNLLAPIFQQFKEGALPGIQGQANAGGGVYNSSTQKLLQGDALARATAQGGAVIATQQNAVQAQIANLLATLARSTATTNQATQQQQNTQKSGQGGNALKAGAAAAGVSGLAKLLDAALKNDQKNSEAQNRAESQEENSLGSGESNSTSSQGAEIETTGPGETAGSFDTGPDSLDLSFLGDLGFDPGTSPDQFGDGSWGDTGGGGGDGGFTVDDTSIFGGESE